MERRPGVGGDREGGAVGDPGVTDVDGVGAGGRFVHTLLLNAAGALLG
ncbi:hypothetical protein [Streptomyces atratus]